MFKSYQNNSTLGAYSEISNVEEGVVEKTNVCVKSEGFTLHFSRNFTI